MKAPRQTECNTERSEAEYEIFFLVLFEIFNFLYKGFFFLLENALLFNR